jgi:hypothetical protein
MDVMEVNSNTANERRPLSARRLAEEVLPNKIPDARDVSACEGFRMTA